MSFGYTGEIQESINIDTQSGWPQLSTGEFKQHRRIAEFYEEQAIADSLNRSVLEVQQQITNAINKGYSITEFEITNGVPQLSDMQTSVYRAAIYSRSHSDLMGYFSTADQKEAGNNKAQDEEQQKQILAQSVRGVRLLLGLGRSGVHTL